jgi:hypothetical protein
MSDLLGALLTLLAVGALGLAGYLLALLCLGEEARRDALSLAVGSLLGMTTVGVGLGLLLGGLGVLRLWVGLAALALLTALLWIANRRAGADLRGPAVLALRRFRDRLFAMPSLSLLALHVLGSEFVRGLLRPPLSWDSLMYHLLLAANWLQGGSLEPVFAPRPIAFYGYNPANGSVWLWWWLAPSHGELWVNLAFLPQLLLLGLATGAVARGLGAVRHWPVASFLVMLLPTVARFAATQYVDIFLAAGFLAALHFGLRWVDRPRLGDALLAGAGIGLAGGAKILGGPYAFILALAIAAAARGAWGARLRHLVLALLLALPLGGYFYLRNMAYGVGPVAAACEGPLKEDKGEEAEALPSFPRQSSVLGQLGKLVREGTLADVFLGVPTPAMRELGVGPVAPLLLLAALLLPLAAGRERRRAALVAWSQVLFQVLFWLTVPGAPPGHVFANVRYLIPSIALALAGAVVAAERRGMKDGWIQGLALAVAAQSLLLARTEMPREARVFLAALTLAAALLALFPRSRAVATRHAGWIAAAVLLAAFAAVPALARFRDADRPRALAKELTVHSTLAHNFAGAWGWLDRHGGDGAVAVTVSPRIQFLYPAMGPRLERRALYVNFNRQDLRDAGAYPRCNPRVDPDVSAWLANLAKQDIRWVHVGRLGRQPFPEEEGWVRSRPDLFKLRFRDANNGVYEVRHEETPVLPSFPAKAP